jgi:carbamoyl-phosphate synthase large subunit
MLHTILISSAGRRNQLIDCFRQDARKLSLDFRVLAADMRPDLSPACQKADAAFSVPRCTSAEFVPALLDLCRRERITLLVPTIDPELVILSLNAAKFAAVGTRVAVSAPEVVALASNKQLTVSKLEAAGVPTPKSMALFDYLRDPSQICAPVIAKPTTGSASVGIVRPRTPYELSHLNPDLYLVQELWQGTEFTVNMFFDRSGCLRSVVPHERIEVRSGEVSKGTTRRVPALEEAARKLALALPGATGPLCFQAVVTAAGKFAVFEINARFGGGFPLAHRAGARFTQWLLEEVGGLPLSANDNWKEGVTMLRFDHAVFLND